MASTSPQPRNFPAPLVGTSAVQIAPANTSRLGIFVYNPGTNTLSVFGADVVNPTLQGPGTMTILPGTGLELDGWTNALQAIASGANSPVAVYEFS